MLRISGRQLIQLKAPYSVFLPKRNPLLCVCVCVYVCVCVCVWCICVCVWWVEGGGGAPACLRHLMQQGLFAVITLRPNYRTETKGFEVSQVIRVSPPLYAVIYFITSPFHHRFSVCLTVCLCYSLTHRVLFIFVCLSVSHSPSSFSLGVAVPNSLALWLALPACLPVCLCLSRSHSLTEFSVSLSLSPAVSLDPI